MKLSILIAVLVCIWSCSPETSPDNAGDLKAILGTWKVNQDSNTALNISGACCDERAHLSGVVKLEGKSYDLDSHSALTRYTVIKPDSGSKPVYVFELVISLLNMPRGSLCGLDGFATDSTGNNEYGTSEPSAIHSLKLTKSVQGDSACTATQEAIEFTQSP